MKLRTLNTQSAPINTQPMLNEVSGMSRFRGSYSLCGLITGIDKNGQPYRKIGICDFNHHLFIHTRDMDESFIDIAPYSFIQCEVKNRLHQGQQYHVADFVLPIAKPIHSSIYMLPYRAAIYPRDVFKLVTFVEMIENKHLKQFITDVLLQPRVTLPYLRNPASSNHHHSFLGGLLRHSIAVVELALEQSPTGVERDIIIVVALLHDIGKVMTLNENMRLTEVGKLVEHDDLTLEICAEPLSRLNEKDAQIASILRHCWTCASPNAR
jgi:3'-5' exoribonuclease